VRDGPVAELRLPNRLLRSRAATPNTEKTVATVRMVRVRVFMVPPSYHMGESFISTSVSVDTSHGNVKPSVLPSLRLAVG
jgi:hypothetical protein